MCYTTRLWRATSLRIATFASGVLRVREMAQSWHCARGTRLRRFWILSSNLRLFFLRFGLVTRVAGNMVGVIALPTTNEGVAGHCVLEVLTSAEIFDVSQAIADTIVGYANISCRCGTTGVPNVAVIISSRCASHAPACGPGTAATSAAYYCILWCREISVLSGIFDGKSSSFAAPMVSRNSHR